MWSVSAVILALAAFSSADSDSQRPRHDSSLEIYKRLFETKRKDQLNALKNLVELNDINQQYKIIDIMLKGLFKVLEDSRQILVAANMQPDDPFPMDDKIKEAYSHVVENTAFFGDVALRFPRIVHHYYDRNADWGGLLRWGLNFCNQTGVFTGGAHQHVLTLVKPDVPNVTLLSERGLHNTRKAARFQATSKRCTDVPFLLAAAKQTLV
uniref:Coiled-coil domain containing 134 n=1 Tax=Nothobranchius furzeri TaxID=105023 RepID=A0A8C6LZ28_NOTFU